MVMKNSFTYELMKSTGKQFTLLFSPKNNKEQVSQQNQENTMKYAERLSLDSSTVKAENKTSYIAVN